MIYRLENHDFVILHRSDNPAGGPLLPTEKHQAITRPGVEGTGFILHGRRGEPFDMRSYVDLLFLDIPSRTQDYHDLVGTVVDVVWQSVDYRSQFRIRYFVANVMIVRSGKLTAYSGGQTSGGNAYLEATWTLHPVIEAT